MRWQEIQEGIFDRFKKTPVPEEPSRFPNTKDPEKLKDWMRRTISWYKYQKWDAWQLFSPYWGDYFPIALHADSSYDENAKKAYRDIKAEYPELVDQARKNAPKGTVTNSSRVGDQEDFVAGTVAVDPKDVLRKAGYR